MLTSVHKSIGITIPIPFGIDIFIPETEDGDCCIFGPGWNGTLNNSGKPMNSASFAYILKGTYKNGEKEGLWESYDENGVKDRFAGFYKNDEKVSD